MADTSSLLNCRTGNCTGGSNPPSSANSVVFQRVARLTHDFTHGYSVKRVFFVFDKSHRINLEYGIQNIDFYIIIQLNHFFVRYYIRPKVTYRN